MISKLAALAAAGYAGYKIFEKQKADSNGVAFAAGEPKGAFRNAGQDSMGSKPTGKWTATDEKLDETFPASDATAQY